jgi:hypothetical protein
LQINWKATGKTGHVKIWISTTNNFKTGGKDDYVLLGTVPLSGQKAAFDLSDKPSGFYKIVLEAPDNNSSYWISK